MEKRQQQQKKKKKKKKRKNILLIFTQKTQKEKRDYPCIYTCTCISISTSIRIDRKVLNAILNY